MNELYKNEKIRNEIHKQKKTMNEIPMNEMFLDEIYTAQVHPICAYFFDFSLNYKLEEYGSLKITNS